MVTLVSFWHLGKKEEIRLRVIKFCPPTIPLGRHRRSGIIPLWQDSAVQLLTKVLPFINNDYFGLLQ